MSTSDPTEEEVVQQLYDYAANLLVHEGKSPATTKALLIQQGLDEESADIIVGNLEKQIKEAKKERGNKDMLYGALWCVGGIVATVADFGFIFWGAIVFGAIQFVRGAINS
jgi:hypothetical protein